MRKREGLLLCSGVLRLPQDSGALARALLTWPSIAPPNPLKCVGEWQTQRWGTAALSKQRSLRRGARLQGLLSGAKTLHQGLLVTV